MCTAPIGRSIGVQLAVFQAVCIKLIAFPPPTPLLGARQVALHMRATRTFTDKTGVMRKNGEEWLIKMEDTEAHIPDVYEEVCA